MPPNENVQRPGLRTFIRGNFSPAFLYPLKGIWYFATNAYLHPLLRSRLIPLTVLSTCILVVLFFTLYIPVVAFLALFHYKGSAWVNATFFVLNTGSVLIAMVFEALFVDSTQVDIFDAVMVAEGYEHLVKNRRTLAEATFESSAATRLGPREKGAQFTPFSFRQIIELLLLLPLNFVPFVGVPLFLLLTGYRAGPLLNWRYFAMKEFTKRERNAFIKSKQRKYEYMWFGTTHMVLQLIPIVNILFLLTIAAASALWSVRIEKETEENEHAEEENFEAFTDEA